MSAVESRLEQLLHAHGIDGISGEDLLAAFGHALEASTGVYAPLTSDEEEFLREYGGSGAEESLGGRDPRRDTAAVATGAARRVAALLAASMSIVEAADLLGVDRSRVSRRCSAGTLWSFSVDGHIRLPRWQFAGDGVLPGLDVVIAGIPDGITPLMVDAVMSSPQEETSGLTPQQYLAEGGAPHPVAEMLEDLARW